MILFHTLVISPGWQVLSASKLHANRVVTSAVNVNLMLLRVDGTYFRTDSPPGRLQSFNPEPRKRLKAETPLDRPFNLGGENNPLFHLSLESVQPGCTHMKAPSV